VIEAKVLLSVPNTKWFVIQNDTRKQIAEGTLQLVLNPSELTLSEKLMKQIKTESKEKWNQMNKYIKKKYQKIKNLRIIMIL